MGRLGFGFGQVRRRRRGNGGTALSAPTLIRTSATATTYPLTFDFTRPIDWNQAASVTGVCQRSQDITFATGVTETTATITGATTSYNFGISAIVSGVWYVRLAAYATGKRPNNLNWSLTLGVGTATAPTMTSSASLSGYQYIAGSYTLTASLPSTFAITGGTDQAQASISGSTLIVDAQTSAGTLDIRVTPTSVFQVAGTEQTITVTNAANTPSAFTFTDVTNASLATLYTSNAITIAGLVGGVSVPVTITGGTYSKNGGAYTSAAGTAVNGDTFAVRVTSGSTNNVTQNVVLTVGSTSDTYTVSTPISMQYSNAATDVSPGLSLSGTPRLSAAGNGTAGRASVRTTLPCNTGKRIQEFIPDTYDPTKEYFFGVNDGTVDFSTLTQQPGASDTHGLSLNFGDWGWEIRYNAGAPQANYNADGVSGGWRFAAGDIVQHEFDTVAQTHTFYRVRSGVRVQIGSTVTGVSSTFLYGNAGTGGVSTFHSNYGDSAFAYTPTTGYLAFNA